jgi:intracellular sulfur oxidation DsrE/DsrF family protein
VCPAGGAAALRAAVLATPAFTQQQQPPFAGAVFIQDRVHLGALAESKHEGIATRRQREISPIGRNSLNSQIWGFKEPNFLCVSATHGPAQLALYDQGTWDKYQLARIAGGNVARNTFILAAPASAHDPADFQSMEGAFSSKDNSIVVLQRRGVVFMACHNAIWEHAERLFAADQNPDHLSVDRIAAELSNHLMPDVVLTPGAVATLVNLQQASFAYSR